LGSQNLDWCHRCELLAHHSAVVKVRLVEPEGSRRRLLQRRGPLYQRAPALSRNRRVRLSTRFSGGFSTRLWISGENGALWGIQKPAFVTPAGRVLLCNAYCLRRAVLPCPLLVVPLGSIFSAEPNETGFRAPLGALGYYTAWVGRCQAIPGTNLHQF
jgi:hypothetical protein